MESMFFFTQTGNIKNMFSDFFRSVSFQEATDSFKPFTKRSWLVLLAVAIHSLVGGNKQVYANLCYWIPFMTKVGRTCAHPVSGGCNMCIYTCIGIYTYRIIQVRQSNMYIRVLYIYIYIYRHIVKNMPMLIKQTHAHRYIHIYNVHHRSIY